MKNILVVTPTLGDRETLSKTVESVRAIGGAQVHHVLTCPPQTVTKLEQKYPHLEVHSDGGTRGIYKALNRTLSKYANNYEFLTYINDDDYWLDGFLDLYTKLKDHPDIKVAYGRVNFISIEGKLIYEISSTRRYFSFPRLITHNVIPFTQQGMLMRSDLFLALGGFSNDFQLVADSDFWIRAIRANVRFSFVDSIVAAYSLHEGQLSSGKELQQKEHTMILKKYGLKKSLGSYYELILFRALNLSKYLKRLS